MKVIFYASPQRGIGQKVQDMLAGRIPGEGLEVHRSIQGLSKRFRYRSQDVEAAVLVAAGQQDLEAFIAMRDLLEDTRIILVLPTADSASVSLSHALYPRFVGYADGSLDDIAAVINHLFGAAPSRQKG